MIDKNAVLNELAQCTTVADIEQFHDNYLGKKGALNALYKDLKDLSPEEKKIQGQRIQELFQEVEAAFYTKQEELKRQQRNTVLEKDLIDISLPSHTLDQGHLTLLNQTRRHVETIFQGMGFHIEYGHDMVTMEENFLSVNIPLTHPATEMHDTLYIEEKDEQDRNFVMRTHTSAHQNELIKKLGTPCKFIVPGKVYRNEKMDASHDCVFRQLEGVVIDRWISIAHFKDMIHTILWAILETDAVELRMRPAYFPFVEPWFEIDAKYQMGKKEKRLEILGAGMIHPNVLTQAGVDPKERSGFAFGMGLTRLVAVKHGISDIRLLTNGDLRFARSF